jgi:glutathione synthase/RimK-type ligase-like ATP-grasp enzyme
VVEGIMSKLIIVVENKEDWEPYYPSKEVITFEEYINLPMTKEYENAQVINLCNNYRYQGKGYYCSLFAEAVEHKVIPSIRAINDLSKRSFYSLDIKDIDKKLDNSALDQNSDSADSLVMTIHFGKTALSELSDLARKFFEIFPFPSLQVKFLKEKVWHIESVKYLSFSSLEGVEEDRFAEGLDAFSHKIWRKPRSKKQFRYSLAILTNVDEKMTPSNKGALKNFVKAGKDLGIEVDLITKNDYSRLSEYDALFIRETTSLNHHTYRFSKKAESEGLVVIDDPTSILRCTNKVYLHKILDFNDIATPKTLIIDKDFDAKSVEAQLGYPFVLKIPDGSFSVGVIKIKNADELKEKSSDLFKKSAFLLAQEYMYTDFDWRVGVLNERAIFVCKYFMSKGHWQIYNHGDGKTQSGNFETLPVHKAPKHIVKTATKAANLIGNGLYGVDIKEVNGKAVVIEINDNPNIDAHVEDAYLGEDLYRKVMEEFLRRLEERRVGVGSN